MAERMRKAATFGDRIRFRFIKAFVRTDVGETRPIALAALRLMISSNLVGCSPAGLRASHL